MSNHDLARALCGSVLESLRECEHHPDPKSRAALFITRMQLVVPQISAALLSACGTPVIVREGSDPDADMLASIGRLESVGLLPAGSRHRVLSASFPGTDELSEGLEAHYATTLPWACEYMRLCAELVKERVPGAVDDELLAAIDKLGRMQ